MVTLSAALRIHIGGWYDDASGQVRWGIPIPHLLSFLAYHDPDAEVRGLDAVPAADRPPVNLVRITFQAMVGIGTLLALLSLVHLYRLGRRRGFPSSAWFFRMVIAAGPAAVVALIAGWVTTEVGRQPWVVYGVMRTDQAVTGADGIPVGYATLAVVYAALIGATAWILRRLSRPPSNRRFAMSLTEIPMVLTLAGLVAYTVLGGADFGAGLWFWLGGRGPQRDRLREHTFQAMGPVWEANHVWLIFVLVVCWTAYPVAFGSIASTLAVPLFIAALGIIMRGTTYALRSGSPSPEARPCDRLDLLRLVVLTPFALGAAVGAIASRRVPVGNAQGDLFSSWLNPTSVLVGSLAVATAAVPRRRVLGGGRGSAGGHTNDGGFPSSSSGRGSARRGPSFGRSGSPASGRSQAVGWPGRGHWACSSLASAVSGVAALALVLRRRFEPARYAAAGAVAAIVVGWGSCTEPRSSFRV